MKIYYIFYVILNYIKNTFFKVPSLLNNIDKLNEFDYDTLKLESKDEE